MGLPAEGLGWAIAALFVLGLVLLAIEAFLPGFGIFGLSGVVSLLGAVYLASKSGAEFARTVAAGMVITVVVLAVLLRLAARRGLFGRLTLRQEGVTGQRELALPVSTGLIGMTGVTLTMLRPAGLVRLGQATVDVVSEGRYLPAGCQVRVTSVEGRRVVVVPVADAPERETAEGQSEPKGGGV